METIVGALGAASVVLLTLVELFLPAERVGAQAAENRRVARREPPAAS